jgi:hypothetical protein
MVIAAAFASVGYGFEYRQGVRVFHKYIAMMMFVT